jgi:hypothetical protein
MEAEQQQNNQKTIVAFIAGLVIGALLMWVFGAQPKKDANSDMAQDDTQEQTSDTSTAESSSNTGGEGSAAVSVAKPTVTAGAGSVAVANQKAGAKVALGDIKYPSEAGWLAVHAVEGGAMGGVLGASRYNTMDGLAPTSIDLLAPTVAGAEYWVVFHEDNKDGKYTSAGDKVMMGADGKPLATSFKAE